MRSRSRFLFSQPLGLIGVLAASLLAGSASAQRPARTFTQADNGRRYSLKRGQALGLRLPSNPSTGYGWQFVGAKPPQLQITDSSYQSAPAARGLVGSGGTQYWQFTARRPGTAVLRLAYHRAWEKLTPADKRYTLTLVIR